MKTRIVLQSFNALSFTLVPVTASSPIKLTGYNLNQNANMACLSPVTVRSFRPIHQRPVRQALVF